MVSKQAKKFIGNQIRAKMGAIVRARQSTSLKVSKARQEAGFKLK